MAVLSVPVEIVKVPEVVIVLPFGLMDGVATGTKETVYELEVAVVLVPILTFVVNAFMVCEPVAAI